MAANLSAVDVECPACGETLTIPVTLASLPKINPADPLFIDVAPDRDAIRQHIEQAHPTED
ncbi:hypothetical protein ACFW2V_02590 [Streptomyces sp. NPDC058947]|uniref:hypothetical protein n=1 Tax=Streptomyces sp. NPDC058947 TaxID=3346675 RepID=UPI0036B2483D